MFTLFLSGRPGVMLAIVVGLGSCAAAAEPPIFVKGRAVETVGDSLLAYTIDSPGGLVVVDRINAAVDTIGQEALNSPFHVQHFGGQWFVSDITETGPVIAVLSMDGSVEQRIELTDLSPTQHQFAVMPGNRVVVIGRGQRLLIRSDSGTDVFALADSGTRPSLLVGLRGGAMHAVPGQHITLYNEFGNIRWRVDWPWAETAYVGDLAVDAAGRLHVLAGVARAQQEFIAYSMVPTTGEVVRWSKSSPLTTFTASKFGEVVADSALRWLPGS